MGLLSGRHSFFYVVFSWLLSPKGVWNHWLLNPPPSTAPTHPPTEISCCVFIIHSIIVSSLCVFVSLDFAIVNDKYIYKSIKDISVDSFSWFHQSKRKLRKEVKFSMPHLMTRDPKRLVFIRLATGWAEDDVKRIKMSWRTCTCPFMPTRRQENSPGAVRPSLVFLFQAMV